MVRERELVGLLGGYSLMVFNGGLFGASLFLCCVDLVKTGYK